MRRLRTINLGGRQLHIGQMEMEPPPRSDEEVVRLFAEHVGRSIEHKPDRENRSEPDIDAIAGNLAIEHTSLDSYEGQRRDGVRFRDVLGDLEREVGPQLPFRLRILVPHDAVSKGSDWNAISKAMRRWILQEGMALAFGIHDVDNVVGIEFEFQAWKDPDAVSPGLFFWRNPPDDRRWLDEFVQEQVERKVRKLAPYKEEGYRTVLLLESSDIAMMNSASIIAAIRKAFGDLPSVVDEVWYADTAQPGPVFFENLTPYLAKEGDDAGPLSGPS